VGEEARERGSKGERERGSKGEREQAREGGRKRVSVVSQLASVSACACECE